MLYICDVGANSKEVPRFARDDSLGLFSDHCIDQQALNERGMEY